MATEGTGPVTSAYFLGQSIGLACMAKLLGVGTNRLRRSANCVPDMRMGSVKAGSHRDSFSIDAFLTTVHESVAETLPDRPGYPKLFLPDFGRFVRRGRAARADDSDFDVASDVEDGELKQWLEKPGTSMAWQVVQARDATKLVKYLPPGNLMELYQHYAATRQLLNAKASSHLVIQVWSFP